jgi:predicted dehydrogenase
VVRTEHARRPEPDPKSNKQKYFLATHGSHIFDTVRFLAGGVTAVRARYLERAGSYLWSIDVAFHDGSLGHITIVIPAAGDFESGIQLFGENGSVQGRVHLPWYRKSGTIECFSAKDGTYRRPLGADADTYKLQLEAFADTVLRAAPQTGASAVDGIENMRALVATAQSSKSDNWVELSTVSGSI